MDFYLILYLYCSSILSINKIIVNKLRTTIIIMYYNLRHLVYDIRVSRCGRRQNTL